MPKLIKNFKDYDLKETTIKGRNYELNNNNILRLWLRFNETLTELSEYSSTTLSYDGSPVFVSSAQVSNLANYPAVRFDNSENTNGRVVFSSTTNALTFTDGSNDDPFSVSFFYNRDTSYADSTEEYFFGKGDGNLSNREFTAYYDVSNNLVYFQLRDSTAGVNISRSFNVPSGCFDNKWTHLCFTYGAPLAAVAAAGLSFYINGVAAEVSSTTNDGSYVAMRAVSDTFFVGANMLGSSEADGYFSEFSVWRKRLSQSEILAIFYATTERWGIKSGFVSLPPRYIIGQRDSATGSYPTILRTGDRDRTGKYNISFNDKFTQIFGKKFVDEFDNYGLGSETSFDSKRWIATGAIVVKKEVTQAKRGFIHSDRVITFGNLSNSGVQRWIKTTEKYRNPVIRFSLIQGPLESTIGNLKLGKPSGTDILKVQASSDNVNWVDIKSYEPNLNQQTFFNRRNSDIKEENYIEAFRSNQVLSRTDFLGISGDFYIRWIHENFNRSSSPFPVWAISRIEIEDLSSQSVNAPLMIDSTSTAGLKAHNNAVASPNIIPQMQVNGRILKGVSDSHITFTPGEDISPFNESLVVEDYSKTFYSTGVDTEVYPGFNQPTRDKTKLVISLNHINASKQSVGYVNPASTVSPINSTSDEPQPVMAYYDNQSKRWRTYASFNPNNTAATTRSEIYDFITGSKGLGFGTLSAVASGSIDDSGALSEQFGKDLLSGLVRPVKTFGFPYHRDFEVVDDKTVKMSDYISHPFLLEKIVVDFPAEFEFAPNGVSGDSQNHHSLIYSYFADLPTDKPSQPKADGHKVMIPTFFVLNQRKDNFKFSDIVNVDGTATVINPAGFESLTVTRENNASLTSTPTTRDLVSYGQITFFASSSAGAKINLEKALQDGLERDLLLDITELNGQSSSWDATQSLDPITGSFRLEFPCRISPKTNNNQRVVIRQPNLSSPEFRTIYLADFPGGRGHSIIDSNNRSLVNGVTSLRPGQSVVIPGPEPTSNPITGETVDSATIDQVSPYILFPEDRLIFGWQYPVPEQSLTKLPSSSGQTLFNQMKLFGETKVYFYGSLLKENKETHNTLNQNLTSNAVHEIIGAEKVLDQFQTNTRHEFTGSFIDQVNYYRSVGASDEIQPIDSFVAGTPYQRDAVSRVSIFDDVGRRYEVGSSTNIYSFGGSTPNNDVSIALASSLFRGFNLKSERRIADANKVSEAYWFDYGTYQNFKNSDTDGGPNVYKNSKVYYNYQHFGHFRDMFEQERDTRFGLGFPSAISIESPVVVQFVSASVDVKKLSLKDFKIQSPSQISSDSNTQSSNMSLNSTSSLPFFDDMTARNR